MRIKLPNKILVCLDYVIKYQYVKRFGAITFLPLEISKLEFVGNEVSKFGLMGKSIIWSLVGIYSCLDHLY